MAEDVGGQPQAPIRLMKFVSEEQLDEAKRSRGERVEDGTAQRDRPLFEILKENKDKRDSEFNERFKHRPPKALDEDETLFLDNLELSRKQYERQIADEEAQQLRSFQAAVAAQSLSVQEVKETPHVSNVQDPKKMNGKKNKAAQPLEMIIKVKPQTKKAKVDSSPEPQPGADVKRPAKLPQHFDHLATHSGGEVQDVTKIGLVSYSDESDDD
ncbi:hypothetical protein RND81_02G000400 [Saponaria officinalis]|uniref:FAM192A/Fyv6 N-terminal domain-containing protein n=1 Tax=Saponaria officinalis TaxID=3572 RepID=A0AAW1MM62_SAPOF